MIELSVITPVWNQANTTLSFLYHNWQVYQSIPRIEFVVINNGSADRTPQLLETWQGQMGDRLQVITNEKNRGFGPANNQGAGVARGKYLAFVSNDVLTMGDWAQMVIDQLALQPEDLVGAELINFDTGWNTFRGQSISYLTGWCVACTKQTFEALGGWDERYVPCDYEDIDLSLTAVGQGRKLVPVPLPVKHRFGKSAETLPGGRQAATKRNRQLFIEKWGF